MQTSRLALTLLTSLLTAQIAIASTPLSTGTKLPIHKSLVAYSSKQGEQFLSSTKQKRDFLSLSRYFISQKNQAYCGVASLVMVLNALNIKRPYSSTYAPYRMYTQNNIFTPKVVKRFKPTFIAGHGLTLQQLNQFAAIFPVAVSYYHAKNDDKAFDQFKTRALKALNDNKQYVIVNYSRKGIDQVGGGHFSPLAAYDSQSDRFLLMDVSRYKYPPVWVKAKTLWQAMATKDSTSQKNRGYLILSTQ